MALVTVQLDPRAQQPPPQIEIAALALVEQIQPRAYRKPIVLGLESINDQMARAPAQRRPACTWPESSSDRVQRG